MNVAECPAGGSFQIAVTAPDGTPLERTGGTGCGSLTIASLPASGVYELRAVDPGGFTGAFRFTATGTPYALGPNGALALPAGTWAFTAAAGQRVFVDGDATVDGAPTPLTLSSGRDAHADAHRLRDAVRRPRPARRELERARRRHARGFGRAGG